jgi:hypothetical protein
LAAASSNQKGSRTLYVTFTTSISIVVNANSHATATANPNRKSFSGSYRNCCISQRATATSAAALLRPLRCATPAAAAAAADANSTNRAYTDWNDPRKLVCFTNGSGRAGL